METLFSRFYYLVENTDLTYTRYLYHQINWNNRLIGIVGSRGVGKTTMLFQYIKQNYPTGSTEVLYVSLDHIWFTTGSLWDLTVDFHNHGGKRLFLDEVHKYPDWSQVIKNIYDSFPEMKIVFTGSSILEIHKAKADLSRRAATYVLHGLSFREFIDYEYGIKINQLSLSDLLEKHVEISLEINKQIKPLVAFNEFLRYGYFPYYKEDKQIYHFRVLETINAIIDIDLPASQSIEHATLIKIKKLLSIISSIVPFTPNITKLASQIEVTRPALMNFLILLHNAHVLLLLDKKANGIKKLVKPEKIYLANTNYSYAFSGNNADIGNVRETFFFSQVQVTNSVSYSDETDFIVDNLYHFEIGGKDKTERQIQNLNNAYLAKDNIETGWGNHIPLWMFGLMY